MSYNIAIDGPAGAGKSTIAREVAKKMDILYLESGALYRAIALFMIREKVSSRNRTAIDRRCWEADIVVRYENGMQVVYLNGENVNDMLRTEAVGNMASVISSRPAVRAHLLELQRKLAREHNCVMDGRDIGTCILPKANVKIYLTASVEVRADRRYQELAEKGENADMQKIKKDIEERDYRDMHRDISPLMQAEDAELVDTSHMTIEEAVSEILRICVDKLGCCKPV